MRVDHRGTHVLVTQQLLNRPSIIPVLQQVGCKGVAQRMAACWLGDPGFQSGCLEGALQDGLVQVVPALLALRQPRYLFHLAEFGRVVLGDEIAMSPAHSG